MSNFPRHFSRVSTLRFLPATLAALFFVAASVVPLRAEQPAVGPLKMETVMIRLGADSSAEAISWDTFSPDEVLYQGDHSFAVMSHDEFEFDFSAEIMIPAADHSMELEFEVSVEGDMRRGTPELEMEFSGSFETTNRQRFRVETKSSPAQAASGTALLVRASENGSPYDVAMLIRLVGYAHAGDGSAATTPATPTPPNAEDEAYLDERPDTNPLRIIMRWQIESAVDNFGYIVYRADALDGEYTPAHRGQLPGVGTTSIPHVFRFLDTDVAGEGIPHFYKVEELGLDGSRSFFPNPATGEVLVLGGPPKHMSRREQKMFEDGPYLVETVER